MRYGILLVVVIGCGDGYHAMEPDGGLPSDAEIAADASPDAPPLPSSLEVDDAAGASLTTIAFVATAPGQRASLTVVVRNTGPTTTMPVGVMTSSPDVTFDPATTCTGVVLAPNDNCFVALSYRPASVGELHATLEIDGADSPAIVPLTGSAMTPSTGLVTDVTMLDFGIVETGERVTAPVLVENAGTSNVTLGVMTATTDFSIVDSNCPTILTVGGACTVTIGFATPTTTGRIDGTFEVPSDAGSATVALTAFPVRRVSVGFTGGGTGTVTSSPSGLTCDTGGCSGLFVGAVAVTAHASVDSVMATWTQFAPTCGVAPTCTSPNGASGFLGVRFELMATAKAVVLSFAGAGTGIAQLELGGTAETVRCTGSCSVYYAPGAEVVIVADSPDKFGSWSGSCVGTTPACNLGTIINDREVTVAFDLDDRELRSILPPTTADAIAFASDGDLVTAGAGVVSRLSPIGEVRWSHALGVATGFVLGVAVASDGDVVQLQSDSTTFPTTLELSRMSATGNLRWTRTFASSTPCSEEPYGRALSTAPNGDVAIVAQLGGVLQLSTFDASGSPRWSVTDIEACAAAIDADGTYHVIGRDDADEAVHQRYDSDGHPLADLGLIPPDVLEENYQLAMAGDDLATFVGYDQQTVTLSLFDPTGVPAFSFVIPTPCCQPSIGVAGDSDGNVITSRDNAVHNIVPGMLLQQWSPAGTLLWTLDKPGFDGFQTGSDAESLFFVKSLATDDAKHVAVSGTFNGVPWIETFVMP